MKSIISVIIAIQGTIFSFGQNSINQVLAQIERNNPELKAVAAEVEAERLAGKAETLLANPEVEFNYLWGAENIGSRHDLRVSQAFDIPTITGMKAGMAEGMGELASLKYKTERQAVLLEAKQACIDLVLGQEQTADNDVASMKERIESRHGIHTVEHAEKIGLGSRKYTIVSIDK